MTSRCQAYKEMNTHHAGVSRGNNRILLLMHGNGSNTKQAPFYPSVAPRPRPRLLHSASHVSKQRQRSKQPRTHNPSSIPSHALLLGCLGGSRCPSCCTSQHVIKHRTEVSSSTPMATQLATTLPLGRPLLVRNLACSKYHKQTQAIHKSAANWLKHNVTPPQRAPPKYLQFFNLGLQFLVPCTAKNNDGINHHAAT